MLYDAVWQAFNSFENITDTEEENNMFLEPENTGKMWKKELGGGTVIRDGDIHLQMLFPPLQM